MAFNDTLFQLGMDLTRSSTAQKEDHARVSSEEGASPRSTTLAGSPLFIDLHGAKRLDDAMSVERSLTRAVESLGMRLKGVRISRNSGSDVSGLAELATGRVTLSACARSGFAAIDAQGCAGLKPEAALIALANAFGAREAVIRKARKTAAIPFVVPGARSEAARKTAKPRRQAKAA